MIASRGLFLGMLMLALPATGRAADLKIASIFTDHGVLQRDRPLPIWGTADANAEVRVSFAQQQCTTHADASGHWRVNLQAIPANSQPGELTVSSGDKAPLILHDLLVGDVWLCSGQSNMGMNVGGCLNAEKEIAAANYPAIRLITITQTPSPTPAEQIKGSWSVCTPETVANHSGASYFFGRQLHQELKIPIGLLVSSVGGTPAESWTSRAALETLPGYGQKAQEEIALWQSQPQDTARYPELRAAWLKQYGLEDPGNSGLEKGWASLDFDDSSWKEAKFPASWASLGYKTGGVFWVRKSVDIPPESAGKSFRTSLNWISGMFETIYFNGVEVAKGGNTPPAFEDTQRNQVIPGKLVKAGRNVLAVRFHSPSPQHSLGTWGYFLGFPVKDLYSINDQWKYQQEASLPAVTPEALKARPKPNSQAPRNVSASLYNGMIAPLIPYGIKGAIWYQGESNAGKAAAYETLLATMITDWRKEWGQGDFPFLIQELVNHGQATDDPNARTSWALIREAQTHLAEKLPNTGIAVGIELGEARNIHPKNKQEVGRRLALVALEKTYDQKIESHGPLYASITPEGSTLRVRFTHASGLHTADKSAPKGFALAGKDGKYVWAEAQIDGDSVLLSAKSVTQPVMVRYAWADNPAGVNLYNAAGLPANPFRAGE